MAAPQLERTYACLPGTERGRGILIAGDAKTERFAYTNGRSVVLRSLENPLECSIYSEHAYATTVARFSPNGEWVASADVSGQVGLQNQFLCFFCFVFFRGTLSTTCFSYT